MSKAGETFFTTVGCMDGRAQAAAAEYGRKKFGAEYADTITEAGLVGKLTQDKLDQGLLSSIKNKFDISLNKHRSRGVVVHGHQECAASDAVDDEKHKDDIRKSVQKIKSLINSSVPVVGIFVKRSSQDPSKWEIEELKEGLKVIQPQKSQSAKALLDIAKLAKKLHVKGPKDLSENHDYYTWGGEKRNPNAEE